MSDPLEQYRKKPLEKTGASTPARPTNAYLAFATKDKVERLKIRRANDPTRSPGYNYLLDVVYDEDYGTNFVLIYTFMLVLVRGRNLQGVVNALQMNTADFIQEFDVERWEKPKDESTPVIESIEVVVQEKGPDIGASEEDRKVH